MSKEQDKKKVTVKKETDVLPAVENKAAETTTDVAAVKVETAPTPKPASKRPPFFARSNSELPTQEEEVSVKLAELKDKDFSDVEIAKVINRFTYVGHENNQAGTSFTLNGKAIEPIIKGVKGNLRHLESASNGYGFDYRLSRVQNWSQLHEEEQVWDLYVYALEVDDGRSPYRADDTSIMGQLVNKLEQKRVYQIVFLAHGSSLSLTDKLKAPNQWESLNLYGHGKPGVGFVSRSDLKDVIFIGNNVVQGQSWEEVIVEDSRVIAGEIWTCTLRNTYIRKSQMIGVNSYGTKESQARNIIIQCYMQEVRLNNAHYVLRRSTLKDMSVTGKSVEITRSRLTGMVLSAKQTIKVQNTGSHQQDNVYFNSNGNIEVNSIYDLTLMPATERLRIALVNGGESFWLTLDGQDDYGSSTHEVAKAPKRDQLENDDRRGYMPHHGPFRFQRMAGDEESMEAYVRRAVTQTIGTGDLADNIIRHVCEALRDRVNIARSIASVKKLEESSSFYNGW